MQRFCCRSLCAQAAGLGLQTLLWHVHAHVITCRCLAMAAGLPRHALLLARPMPDRMLVLIMACQFPVQSTEAATKPCERRSPGTMPFVHAVTDKHWC